MTILNLNDLFEDMKDIPEFIGVEMDDVDVVGNFGNRPLHVIAGWGDVKGIKNLACAGANVNAQGEEGMTPLHRAVAAGNLSAVAELLDIGAEASIKDVSGKTALDLALILSNKEIINMLINCK